MIISSRGLLSVCVAHATLSSAWAWSPNACNHRQQNGLAANAGLGSFVCRNDGQASQLRRRGTVQAFSSTFDYSESESVTEPDPNPIFGLTDDGDFCLSGINHQQVADSGPDGDSSNVAQGLESMQVANANYFDSRVMDLLSTTNGASDPSASNGANAPASLGLSGINASNSGGSGQMQPPTPLADAINAQSQQPQLSTNKQGQFLQQQDTIPQSVASQIVPYQPATEADMDVMKGWLLQHIPTLKPHDSQTYAHNLCMLGFDPECVTQCELRFDDLSFMKMLHQRYLFREITGQEHPWDV